jgi:hypothetical protein
MIVIKSGPGLRPGRYTLTHTDPLLPDLRDALALIE